MTDPAEPPAPPPSGPLRLDGAFPRRDLDDWQAAAEASLKGDATLASLGRETPDALPIEVLYHDSPVRGRVTPPSCAAAADAPEASSTVWDNRLHVLGATAAARAAHARAGLVGGVASLELDVAVRSAGAGGVGNGASDGEDGAALSLDALSDALEGVHLEMITLALRAGDDPEAALDALLALYRERGHDLAAARVELDADPFGELARRGRLAGGADAAFERLGRLAERAAHELPLARVVSIDTAVHHAAGATPVQELVAGVAAGTAALDALLDAGLEPARALRAIGFRVALDADLVGGVVKLRALERLWRHALVAAALPGERAYVVAETSRRPLSRLDPWVNHLRNVQAGTAAAIGGADVVIVHPHDRVDGERVGVDAAVADRVARNLPLLLAEEGGLLAVEDAAGGAHAIESLTQATAEAAWAALGELQSAGGLGEALASGAWQADVARAHRERVERLARGERVRVAVTRFREDGVDVVGDEPAEGSDERDTAPPGGAPSAAGRAGTSAASAAGGEPRSATASPLPGVRDARPFERVGRRGPPGGGHGAITTAGTREPEADR